MALIGEINPQKKVPTKLPVEKSAREAHDKVLAEFGSGKQLYLIGRRSYVPGHVGRNFANSMRNALDDIGYEPGGGDHSDPNIIEPGTKPRSDLKAGKKGKGSWIPDLSLPMPWPKPI